MRLDDANTFILKVWSEEKDAKGNPLDCRCHVQHLQGSEPKTFTDLGNAFKYIERVCGYKIKKKRSKK